MLLRRHFNDLFKEGQKLAQNEILNPNVSQFAEPLTNEQFLQFLNDETFDYVGQWAFDVEEAARIAMREAIKDGQPISSVINVLDTETKRVNEVSTERYARTKFTEAMNRGRLAFFETSPDIAAYQYSAIMDGSTTVICSGLHGKIFKRGTEPVPPMHFNCRSTLIPITRFEQFEVDKTVKEEGKRAQNIDSFIDENKGKGFARR